MLHGSPHPGVAGSELTRLLARLADTPAADHRPAFAERLGQWLGWTEAIALSSALNAPSVDATPAHGQPGGFEREAENFRRVHDALAASIAAGSGELSESAETASSPTDFTPHRRHCLARQQAMHDAVAGLRQRLREVLARHSPDGARIAAIDAVMDPTLAVHERGLLGLVPLRLQAHFERLHTAAAAAGRAGDAARTSRWEEVFRDDMNRVLQAELAHRMLPSRGLLDTLRTRTST